MIDKNKYPYVKNPRMYTSEGWPDWEYINSLPGSIFLIWGGRGTGKTFNALNYYRKTGEEVVYSMRTRKKMEMALSEAFQPYAPINKKLGTNIHPFSTGKETYEYYEAEVDDKGKLQPVGEPVAQIINMVDSGRGINGEKFNVWIHDEFIPDEREKRVRGEFESFMNIYESINRNRELEGRPAARCFALSNSTTVDSPIFLGLKVVTPALELAKAGGGNRYIQQRGIQLICMSDSPISRRKSQTALYKAVGEDSDFFAMAIRNAFAGESDHHTVSRNLNEYIPYCFIGEIGIYYHKSKDIWYVSPHQMGVPKFTFQPSDIGLSRFRYRCAVVNHAYILDQVEFETRASELLFEKYFEK